MKAAIFDIDGVLAETLPRVRIHLWEKTKPDWNSFYADQRYDNPIPWTFTFMDALAMQGYKIAILTGRPAEFRDDTIKWLAANEAKYHLLWLRGDDDYRPPQEAKLEQLQKLRKRGWDVELAFEDHPETIQMYMDEGLMVYITPHFFSWKEGEVGRAGEELKPEPEFSQECNNWPTEDCEGGCPTEYSSENVKDFFEQLKPVDEEWNPGPTLKVSHNKERYPHSSTDID
jgi:beta-phosphoglucomutase-like phosphatase (HAD superfamily)